MEYHNLVGQARQVKELSQFLSERGFTITLVKANNATNGNLWASRND